MNRDESIDLLRDGVDLKRYPIDKLGGLAGKRLVEKCQESLSTSNFFVLPGFITPEASASMANATETLLPDSYFFAILI